MQTQDIRRWFAASAVAAVMCAATPAFAAGKAKSQFCASVNDLDALNARVLQTELMVAALSCNERQRYNTFVTTYQPVLIDRGKKLQAMFKRAHGKQATTRLNAFITKLANDSSRQIRDKGDEYCVFAGELFDETAAAKPTDFSRLAKKPWIEGRHGFQPCVMEASRKQTG